MVIKTSKQRANKATKCSHRLVNTTAIFYPDLFYLPLNIPDTPPSERWILRLALWVSFGCLLNKPFPCCILDISVIDNLFCASGRQTWLRLQHQCVNAEILGLCGLVLEMETMRYNHPQQNGRISVTIYRVNK